ncbi:MAG: Ig-like domain-containing protein [Thermoanaerobaculia bacterium]|nr:Ig-like domain-containing protein [Thermoanaerobaculia bacterium]
MKRFFFPALFLIATYASAANTLRVTTAGPVGEVATLREANEVRVVFSEPMVALGKIPEPVTAPFLRIDPPVAGTFRWSGTTTLIFTPKAPLPFSKRFEVTVDASAKSVAGNTLDRVYRFAFMTPSIRLTSTEWYRKGGRADAPVIIALRFNQPVDVAAIVQHLQLRTAAHDVQVPQIMAPAKAGADFSAKQARAVAAGAAGGVNVFANLAQQWDKERFPPANDLVVLETKPGIVSDTWIEVLLDDKLAGRSQQYTVQLEPMFFVNGMGCRYECDPDSSNPIDFRSMGGVRFDDVSKVVTVTDITDPAKEVKLIPKTQPREYDYPSTSYTLDELGYTTQPARTYRVRVEPSLPSIDGQRLDYVWTGVVEYWHRTAFISFGDGHGVWESSGGSILPFHARNVRSVQQWLAPLSLDELVPTIVALQNNGYRSAPPKTQPKSRALEVVPDKTQSIGLDIAPAIGSDNKGLLWAAMKPANPIAKSRLNDPSTRASIVQATNLGISVKDSPLNTLVLVTRLDDGAPVAAANVTIRTVDNKVFWSGTTDAHGIAIAEGTRLRIKKRDKPQKPAAPNMMQEDQSDYEWWRVFNDLHFVVTAEKDGDIAYVGSDWNEGITPWEFNANFTPDEALPLLRGTIFTDRGVYKLGEEVNAKLVVRSDTPTGMQLLPSGTKISVALRDSQNKEIAKKELSLNDWSSSEWQFRVPADAPLGTWTMFARIEGQERQINGDFLVAAYRRPDFRVDVTLDAPTSIAGTNVTGRTAGRYLYGGAMANRDARWTWSKMPSWDVPQSIRERWPADRYTFLGWDDDRPSDRVTVTSEEPELDAQGNLTLTLPTEKSDGWPYDYRLETEVTDVTRQRIANRATFRVDPAPWYIGVKTPPYFGEAKNGIDTEIVAAGVDGLGVAGVRVQVSLLKVQYNSVRRASGNGFYEWETERKDVPSGEWTITTQSQPVPLRIPIAEGGQYRLIATANDGDGRTTTTRLWFYASGPGYSAWERYDHNRIDLIPEKKNYKPGDTARIMIKSPWERATALLTTEREGVRTWTPFELTSTQQTITVPITERDIPNVFISVLLIKGRTQQPVTEDAGDPGKPAFRLGYVELKVEDALKRLKVDVDADRDEFRPGSKARVDVNVKDASGKPSQSEVTLWAVDYGVLSLTAYQTPDVLDSIYLDKALQVLNEDSRQRIVSRRVLTPKGASDGGGGGRDAGPGTMRKDFRVLAFWLGSIVTDASGKARTEVKLPESLTTYRIMAVAGDRTSRFGWAQDEIKVNKPLMLTPAFPRFLTPGDTATFGAAVHNQLKRGGKATVTIKSLDPSVITINGSDRATIEIKPGAASEVRFDAVARSVGIARIQMSVKMGRESDSFEDVIPVRVLVSPETVAAYGEAKPKASEKLELPTNVVPGFGGLRLELSSTAMVGLGEGARYLVEYPYGCAEQRASTGLALMLAADLGEAFDLPGVDAANARPMAQSNLTRLEQFQCGNGGFAFWPGQCTSVSPYLSSYVMHVLQRGKKLGYNVSDDTLNRGYEYLTRNLSETPGPVNEGWWPAYTAWQAFAVKVLAEGGRNADSHINRLFGYADRMPIFGISHLADALIAKGEKGERLDDLLRRIRNAMLPEAGFAHVGELSDPYLLWFWNSNVRSTAIAMGTLVRNGSDEELVKRMVRWLMRVRKDGRWGNTQENAWAMGSLVDYYRKYESEAPDFAGIVTLGAATIAQEEFRGRSTEAKTKEIPIGQLSSGTITFDRQGSGTLFYLMRLRYASLERNLGAMNQGFVVERRYDVNDAVASQFKAGDLVRVTLTIRNTKERRFVAVTDPIPAGTEPVDTLFATTASDANEQRRESARASDWTAWWQRGGWDHEERHDDRINVFATRLSEGEHTYTYLLRATTSGTFMTAPAHVEEMYEPEVFGRTASSIIEVSK